MSVGSSLTLHVGIETALGGLIGVSLIFSPKMRDTAFPKNLVQSASTNVYMRSRYSEMVLERIGFRRNR